MCRRISRPNMAAISPCRRRWMNFTTSRSSSRVARSMARRSMVHPSTPSAARGGLPMGVSNYLYDYGFKYQDPKKPYAMQGFVNSPGAVKGLESYKELYKCCTPPGASNSYMSEGLDAFKSGQVALQMNFFAFFPGLYKDPNVGGDKIGFFVNPAAKEQATQLGGQGISVVSYSNKRADSLQYIKWFAQPDVQKKWWALGGYSCLKAVLNDPGFPNRRS